MPFLSIIYLSHSLESKHHMPQVITKQEEEEKEAMRPLPSLHHLLLLLLPPLILVAKSCGDASLIAKTCRNASRDDPNINYKSCVASLQAAPGGECASLRGLGALSMGLVRDNATDTSCYIKMLLRKRWDAFTRQCLEDCLELYHESTSSVREAMKCYRGGDFGGANAKVSAAMTGFSSCEDGFKDKKGGVSPLKKRNNDAFQLSAIALSIMRTMQHRLLLAH